MDKKAKWFSNRPSQFAPTRVGETRDPEFGVMNEDAFLKVQLIGEAARGETAEKLAVFPLKDKTTGKRVPVLCAVRANPLDKGGSLTVIPLATILDASPLNERFVPAPEDPAMQGSLRELTESLIKIEMMKAAEEMDGTETKH